MKRIFSNLTREQEIEFLLKSLTDIEVKYKAETEIEKCAENYGKIESIFNFLIKSKFSVTEELKEYLLYLVREQEELMGDWVRTEKKKK